MALWQPTDLGTDLRGWFDGSDAGSIVLNGSGVSSWGNKGVAGFYLADSTGADVNRPRYTGSAVTFTTPQVFHVTWPPDLTTCDFLVVGKPNDSYDWRTLLHNSDGHNLILIHTGSYEFGAYNEIPPYWQQAGTLTWPVVDGLAYGRIGSGPQVVSRDGGTLYSTTIVQPVDKTVVNYVGGYYGPTGGNQAWGSINELIFVPYDSSDDVRQKLEGYAAWKWGLEALLPVDHPYKSAAPVTGSAVSTLTPDADSIIGTWTNELGGTSLYGSIDEATDGDTDYIISSDRPVSDICKIRLSNPTANVTTPFTVSYRYKKQGTQPINFRVRLLEGTTQIASWTHTAIDTAFVTATQSLSGVEVAVINDPTNLFLEFQAYV